jgi:hypothetical protein
MHFIFESIDGIFWGNIHGEITTLGSGGFLSWIDNSRFIYDGVIMGEINKEGQVRVIDLPSGTGFFPFMTHDSQQFTFVFVNPK